MDSSPKSDQMVTLSPPFYATMRSGTGIASAHHSHTPRPAHSHNHHRSHLMSSSAQPHIQPAVPLADMAAVAALVCASSPSSRPALSYAGGSSPHTRGFGGMAAANSVFPAAKSANQACSRRQTTQPRAKRACSRRQIRREFCQSHAIIFSFIGSIVG